VYKIFVGILLLLMLNSSKIEDDPVSELHIKSLNLQVVLFLINFLHFKITADNAVTTYFKCKLT
jgi:hypothetical protein